MRPRLPIRTARFWITSDFPVQPFDRAIDELGAAEAERRVSEVESGKVKPIPGEHVFK
jgi:hypothetical protein